VKNWHKTISIEERLDVVSRIENGERIIDICHNGGFDHSSVHTICDNADRITGSVKSGTKLFV
jgi:hypothetical protein